MSTKPPGHRRRNELDAIPNQKAAMNRRTPKVRRCELQIPS
jgi:hypothetical protein